ncbi:odorant receptor 94a-like [Aricia agestis]|uniref:odorant receptor 94a-like n=1 Tax=Aricia agestis TaxID=91739 RepID=UPI001C20638D|nr:odorant receptor 94a-like [Aricia agestis]
MEEKYAFDCITPQLKHLRFCGYYQLDPNTPKYFNILHKIYMRFSLILITVFAIQEAVHIFNVQDDREKMINVLFLFLTHTDSIYKQAVFWLKEDKIEGLLDTMRGPIYNQGQPEHRMYFQPLRRIGSLLLRVDNGMALMTCFLWMLLPVIGHIQSRTIEFSFWVPYDYNRDPHFYFTAIYVWVTESWQAFGNTTMDIFIAVLLAQCKIQIQILRFELTNLVKRSKDLAQESDEPFEEALKQRFEMLVLHHWKILDFVNVVQEIYGGAIFYQFLVGGWIICTSVYKMADLNPASVEFVSMTTYMFCILTEIFVYCYYGSELTNESDMLTNAVYFMDWLEISPLDRKKIIILMERVKRPIVPIAGNLIPLSNVTFVKVVKSSYSFFALLKATNE